MQQRFPGRAIQKAVKGMLPKGPLGYAMIKKLKVYAGAEHRTLLSSPSRWNSKGNAMIGNWNYGTGRRKTSVARVFIKKGSGKIVVNGKPVDEFFARETGRMIVRQPLELTGHLESFDIKVNVPVAVKPARPARCVTASRAP